MVNVTIYGIHGSYGQQQAIPIWMPAFFHQEEKRLQDAVAEVKGLVNYPHFWTFQKLVISSWLLCLLVGGLVAIFYFSINIGFLIIPIDELIFFRGVAQPPTSQSCSIAIHIISYLFGANVGKYSIHGASGISSWLLCLLLGCIYGRFQYDV